MTIGERIKKEREKSGLTQSDIAKKVGCATQTVFKYENGIITNIPLDKIAKIAKVLDVTPAYLMGWNDPENTIDPFRNNLSIAEPSYDSGYLNSSFQKVRFERNLTSGYVTYPVYTEVTPGYENFTHDDNTGETVDIPLSALSGHMRDEFFVMRIKGDSMYPDYREGDKVLILRQPSVDYSGQIGAILCESDAYASLKKIEFKKGEEWLKLVSVNPAYPSRRIENINVEKCKILGIPKLLLRDISD